MDLLGGRRGKGEGVRDRGGGGGVGKWWMDGRSWNRYLIFIIGFNVC